MKTATCSSSIENPAKKLHQEEEKHAELLKDDLNWTT